LFQILFDHGIDTILSPLFGSELLHRGDEYVAETLGSIAILESDSFCEFYEAIGARVRFYGNYPTTLAGTPYSDLKGILDRITSRTRDNHGLRLFFGLFANDATQAIANYSIDYFKQTGLVPDRRDLVISYYGEYVEPVSIFIGFDKPSVFDYPLLSVGEEDLYFTVAPSPYLDANTLRIILYDHIFLRRAEEPDWFSMPASDRNRFKQYYLDNKDTIIGSGVLDCNVWLPYLK
jgi:tuberculosinol/isotuberculosinol synthase